MGLHLFIYFTNIVGLMVGPCTGCCRDFLKKEREGGRERVKRCAIQKTANLVGGVSQADVIDQTQGVFLL